RAVGGRARACAVVRCRVVADQTRAVLGARARFRRRRPVAHTLAVRDDGGGRRMSENTVAQTSSFGLGKSVIVGFAGLFYAYAVWNAVAYLMTVAPAGINAYGWFVLIFSVLFPVLVFVKIGRASCRERVERSEVAVGVRVQDRGLVESSSDGGNMRHSR